MIPFLVRSKKTNGCTLNLTNSNISHTAKGNTNDTNTKAEPKVLFVPNITTNVNTNMVSFIICLYLVLCNM